MLFCRGLKNLISLIQSVKYPPFSLLHSPACRHLSIGRQMAGDGPLTVLSQYFHSAMFLKFWWFCCVNFSTITIQPQTVSHYDNTHAYKVSCFKLWGDCQEELSLPLDFLILLRTHFSDGNGELWEVSQIHPAGIFEDPLLENRLNFLILWFHLLDGEIAIQNVESSTPENRNSNFLTFPIFNLLMYPLSKIACLTMSRSNLARTAAVKCFPSPSLCSKAETIIYIRKVDTDVQGVTWSFVSFPLQ